MKENGCGGNCEMNYCDENGCVDRKRILSDPIDPVDTKEQLEDTYDCPDCKTQCVESELLEDDYAKYKGFSEELFCPNCKSRVE